MLPYFFRLVILNTSGEVLNLLEFLCVLFRGARPCRQQNNSLLNTSEFRIIKSTDLSNRCRALLILHKIEKR